MIRGRGPHCAATRRKDEEEAATDLASLMRSALAAERPLSKSYGPLGMTASGATPPDARVLLAIGLFDVIATDSRL